MKKSNTLIICTLLFLGCNSNNSVHHRNYPIELTNTDMLHGQVLTTPVLSKDPIGLFYSQYGLIAVPAFKEGVIQLIDTISGGIILTKYTRGKAPNELLNPMGMDYNPENSTFCIWDLGKQNVNLYKVTSNDFQLFRSINYSGINPSIIRNLNDSTDVILTSIPNQALLVHNKEGVQCSIPYQILNEPGLNYFDYYYPSDIDVCTKSNLIFTADPYLPYISAYSYSDERISKLWDKMVFQPKYTIKKKWRYILDDSYIGFKCISVSNNFIYLTHYGITRVQWDQEVQKKLDYIYLMIFDFDGNMVKHLILDQNVSYITVSPDDRVLYGLTEMPDRFIVKYQL